MTPDDRAEIQNLAAQVCPASCRYITSTSTTQHQCERGPHDGTAHWDSHVVWFGPAEPVQRAAS